MNEHQKAASEAAMEDAFLSIEGRGLRLMMGDQATRDEWELFQIAWKAAEKYFAKAADAMPKTPTASVKEVFAYWVERMGKTGSAKLTNDRRAKIAARLREGYTIDYIKQAIDGCALSPFHMGENRDGKFYNSLELICRTGGKLEEFHDSVEQQKQSAKVAQSSAPVSAGEKNVLNVPPPAPTRPPWMIRMSVQAADPTRFNDRELYERSKADYLEEYGNGPDALDVAVEIAAYEQSEEFKRRF